MSSSSNCRRPGPPWRPAASSARSSRPSRLESCSPPVDGTVAEANQAVLDAPELVNSDPFGEGWLISVTFAALPDGLLSYDEYKALTGEPS